ncbi:hypothetical protein TNCV_1084541 [Trichonephila clavipes]|nr:hypothetical protein TNCV_1084541 [Trichonephila clavipes]
MQEPALVPCKMPLKAELSDFAKSASVGYHRNGRFLRGISCELTIPNVTENFVIKKRKKGTTDRRGRSHLPQCTTSCEDSQIVHMAVMDRSVTSRAIAQHIKTFITWSTLDAEPQTSPQPMVR